jgi:ketosteroid isomerase-like protein
MRRSLTILILMALLAITVPGGADRAAESLASMVATERAFARTSVEQGMRDAFLAFFAEDGISFEPEPVNTKEAMRKRPGGRPAFTLNWSPVYGDVALAGDLGYLTGPYEVTEQSAQKRPPRYGCYFSIWKKQADGKWRVVVDLGIGTPSPVTPLDSPFKAARRSRGAERTGSLADQVHALMDTDRIFARAAAARGVSRAFRDYLADDARLHRDDLMPLIGSRAIIAHLTSRNITATWDPIKADVSRSGDLGYTVGSYETNASDGSGAEKGYYVRVWKRGARRGWKVVFDTTSRLPAKAK